jgi:hypothetical protein
MRRSLETTLAAVVVLVGSPARAATTAECLAASEASLKAETEHKLRDERARLLVCASPTCPAAIRKECVSRVDAVNAQIPTIVFGAKDGTGTDLVNVKVSVDGEPLTDKLDGVALAVDPGQHTFVFEAAGHTRITKSFLVQQSQKDRHEVVVFDPVSTPAAAPADPGLGAQRIAAIAAGVVGVAGLGLGAVFGGLALSEKSTAQAACPGSTCATSAGSDDWSRAKTSGTVSTVGFIVGGVGVAAGAVLWLTAPRSAVEVGLGPGALRLQGSF